MSSSSLPSVRQNLVEGSPVCVVLFGWAGSIDRYIEKYSKMYAARGYSTARFITPMQVFPTIESYNRFTRIVYEQLLAKDPPQRIVFHVFSMNGFGTLSSLWELLETVPNGRAIKQSTIGLIFDSAPADVTPWQSGMAVTFAVLSSNANVVLRGFVRALLTVIFTFHWLYLYLYSFFQPAIYASSKLFYRARAYRDWPRHQLYVCSTKDVLCSSATTLDFAEWQRTHNGAAVTLREWTDSLHCEHYRIHSEEYENLCVDLIREALNGARATDKSPSSSDGNNLRRPRAHQ